MKVLILGASGMLGHTLLMKLSTEYDVYGTCRSKKSLDVVSKIFPPKRLFLAEIDLTRIDALQNAIAKSAPDVIINCVGIVKQLDDANSPIPSISINALFPHLLAEISKKEGAYMIHFSTDCVFSGRTGNYAQNSLSDAEDLYGRTKYLGETSGEDVLTLRSSIIGRELDTKHGLVEWLVGNRGKTVKGYTNAIYSGFTTLEMGEIVKHCITKRAEISGVWQVASYPITKYDLINLINNKMSLGIKIEPDETLKVNRSLDGHLFNEKTGYRPPSWHKMIDELVDDAMMHNIFSDISDTRVKP